jgi:prohibitin 2
MNTFPMNSNLRLPKILFSIVIIIGLIWLVMPFSVVPAGYRGVLTTFGSPSAQVYNEGLNFRWPIAQRMRIQKGEGEGEAASKDLQTVHTRVALNYHIKPEAAITVFRDLGNEPADRIIVPSVHESVKAVTARFTAEDLISKRTEVRDQIVALLRDRLGRHGIMVDEFSILNFNFSKTFNEAIEAKTTAEQLKLKAERDLMRIEVEAKQKITSAKAEAESLALQRQQVSTDLLRLREIENQAEAIKKWDGRLPQATGGVMPFVNIK